MKIQTSNHSPLQDISRLISSFKFIKKLSTFYSQLSTPNFPLTTFHFQLTTFHLPLTTFYFSLFTIIYSPFTISAQRSLATLEDDMVLVEGGSFIMGGLPGRDDKNGLIIYDDEKPAHEVRLASFYISKYEVTQQLWQQVMGNNPSYYSSCGPLCSVEQVSWYDCVEFCNKLSIMQGLSPVYTIDKNPDPENGNIYDDVKWQVSWNMEADGYRLPCEAEWEYAARGGNKSKDYQFSGSDDIDAVAWNDMNSGSKTHPIATKAANELGFYDFSGNVWEWCYDFYPSSYGSSVDNCKDGRGRRRIYRGGSWHDFAQHYRVSNRGASLGAIDRNYEIGFRLSRTVRL